MSDDAALAEQAVKLHLDEVTGDMVSKNELRKRQQKRAKKAAAAEARAQKTNQPQTKPEPKKVAKAEEQPLDMDSMFKNGFLADVYKERPVQQVVTRFPPEPNGFLHLGHAKAICVNFGFARYRDGKTNLRFDDTNPTGEREIYFVEIEEAIRWLGFKPDAITYSSDNFQKLYDLAENLIRKGKAYVCHCQSEEIKRQHGGEKGQQPRYRCEHAEQDSETNIGKFRDMRDGKYPAKAAFLRMKQDIENPNPQMWDVAAYRIPDPDEATGLPTPHHRTKHEWNIYPTYDFAHCICDSIEGITHSLCTTEFVLSRESYEWLNSALEIYEPMQREYGRLNVTGAVMSKRIITTLVNAKVVSGWDDPRLYTLAGLRRRGVPPGAILAFVHELGVTTAQTVIQTGRFEQAVRRYLETTVPRLMLVLDPVPVKITNFEELAKEETEFDIPFMPKSSSMGSHRLALTKVVYIDRSDFQITDDKNFFRLAPGKTVGLLHFAHPIRATSFSQDDGGSGLVTEIEAVFDKTASKPKAYIQWVPEGSQQAEVRFFSSLFKSDNPKAAVGGVLGDVNPDNQTVYPRALIESGYSQVQEKAPWPQTPSEKEVLRPESTRFQGIRVGYFAADLQSTPDHLVLNRIVALKEDSAKG